MRRSVTGQRLTVILIVYIAFVLLILSFQSDFNSNNIGYYTKYYYSNSYSSNTGRRKKLEKYEIVGENGSYFYELDSAPSSQSPINNHSLKNFRNENEKIILFWNTYEFNQQHLGGCYDWNCRIETDRNLLNVSSAVVFYGSYTAPYPSFRYPWQHYVFFTQESPVHAPPIEPYPGFYNTTLSYRRDADAPSPYGYTIKRAHPLTKSSATWQQLTNQVKGKRKLAAWFVSNCGAPSGRDKLVQEMKRYMQIDVYGNCGDLKCPQGRHSRYCREMLNEDYKFYLAFENSICKDYVTEKFWEKVGLNVLVVVLKRSVVERYVPPQSFIAVDDFRSPKALVDYLLSLNADTALYLNYFKWRLQYDTIFLNGDEHDSRERPWGFCRLCQTLHKSPQTTKIYPSIQKWWVDDAHCDNGLVDRLLTATR